MTSFTEKDICGLKQCPICKKWSNIIKEQQYWCWNCKSYFKQRLKDARTSEGNNSFPHL
ncbi:MAG: hypothetical protein ACFFDN_26630 [Candidatus Hodarchaeota archaeon]